MELGDRVIFAQDPLLYGVLRVGVKTADGRLVCEPAHPSVPPHRRRPEIFFTEELVPFTDPLVDLDAIADAGDHGRQGRRMIEGQTSIPVPAEPTAGLCAWCGTPATSKVEMEPAVRGKDKATGVQVIKRHAITAWACESHLRSLQPSERAAKALTREDKKAGGAKGIVIR